jgi:hypothetical protein
VSEAVTDERTTKRPRRPPVVREPLTVTFQDAMALSGLGHSKLSELIRDRTLKTVAVGTRRLIVFDSLKALLTPD